MASVHFVLVALLFLVLPCFADVGPSPAAPKVIVRIINNGQPEMSVAEITYHCMGTTEPNVTSAVEPYPVRLHCSGGKCTNSEWYYKFNPCFGFPGGYFSYNYKGRSIRTETFNFTSRYEMYDITIDAPTGQMVPHAESGCSLVEVVLPAILLSTVFWSRRSGSEITI